MKRKRPITKRTVIRAKPSDGGYDDWPTLGALSLSDLLPKAAAGRYGRWEVRVQFTPLPEPPPPVEYCPRGDPATNRLTAAATEAYLARKGRELEALQFVLGLMEKPAAIKAGDNGTAVSWRVASRHDEAGGQSNGG